LAGYYCHEAGNSTFPGKLLGSAQQCGIHITGYLHSNNTHIKVWIAFDVKTIILVIILVLFWSTAYANI